MAYRKRTRTYNDAGAGYSRASKKARGPLTTSQRFTALNKLVVPGYTRLSGNYGRFKSRVPVAYRPESKFFDTALSFLVDTTPEVPASGQLALIPQGDTESTRDGRQCTIESIQIRASLAFQPSTAAVAATHTDIYLVLDTQCNGAAAAVADVFSGGTTIYKDMLNLSNSGRFRILKHFSHDYAATAGATTAYNNIVKQIEFFKKCNIPMQYNSTAGAITEIRSNNLFLIAGSVANDDLVTVTGNCRLRFRG